MATPRGIGRLCLAAAAAGLSVVLVQSAILAETVKGDLATWNEVAGAWIKQSTMSYRGKFTTGAAGGVEYAPHDSKHVYDGAGVESIRLGRRRWWKRQGKWDCAHSELLSIEQMGTFWGFPGEVAQEVTVTRIPGLVIGGMQTRGYAQTWTAAGVTENDKLYVGVQNDLPLRLISEGGTPKHTTTIDFYDYGANIVVASPC